MQEFADELAKENKEAQLDEMGDVLFAVVNAARLAGIHPEEALQQANEKFYRRFTYVESKVKESGRPHSDVSLEQLDQYWDEAKKQGR